VPLVTGPPAGPFVHEASAFDVFPPSGQSPKEIAADDFNRTWSGEPPRHNQLFNSQSGLFESVDGRRTQNREHGSRQPAVLQRHMGPAEPSAAFQTHRSGEMPFRQRNRTGSSGSAGRRMSFSRPHDFPVDRYDGPAQAPPLTPGLPDASPIQMAQRPWRAQESVAPIQAPQAPAPVQGPPAEAEEAAVEPPADPVAAQQILMREKLERARLQKQREREAEEREEQARKERLREKMKALEAAAPEKPKEVASPQPKPAQVSSPPKPPIPTAEGEVAQYGMMKVHQPHPVKRSNFAESAMMGQERKDANQRLGQRLTSMDKTQKFGDRRPLETEASPWRSNALPDSLSGWSNAGGANVWAPPQSKDRALGNGIFDTSGFRIPLGVGGVAAPVTGAHVAPANISPAANNAPPTIGPIAPPSSLSSIVPPQLAPPTSHTLPIKTPSLPRSDDTSHPDPQPSSTSIQDPAPMAITTSTPARYDGKNTTPFKAEYTLADWQNLPGDLQTENARWMEAAARRTENPQASRPQMSTIKHTFRKIAPPSHYLEERKVISEETKVLEPTQKDKESFQKALESGEHSEVISR
jgi:hypothetical protein